MAESNNRPGQCPPSFERLIAGIRDPDPNHRIATIRSLADGSRGFSEEQRQQIVVELLPLLEDDSTDTYTYGFFMCDEEEPASRVCDEVTIALESTFGYADTRPA